MYLCITILHVFVSVNGSMKGITLHLRLCHKLLSISMHGQFSSFCKQRVFVAVHSPYYIVVDVGVVLASEQLSSSEHLQLLTAFIFLRELKCLVIVRWSLLERGLSTSILFRVCVIVCVCVWVCL